MNYKIMKNYNNDIKTFKLIANRAGGTARKCKNRGFVTPLTLHFDSFYRTSFPCDSILVQSKVERNGYLRNKMFKKSFSAQRNRIKSNSCIKDSTKRNNILPLKGIPLIKKFHSTIQINTSFQATNLINSNSKQLAIQTDLQTSQHNKKRRAEEYWNKYMEVANRYRGRIFQPMYIMKIRVENKCEGKLVSNSIVSISKKDIITKKK